MYRESSGAGCTVYICDDSGKMYCSRADKAALDSYYSDVSNYRWQVMAEENEEEAGYLSKKRIVYTDYKVVYKNVKSIAALKSGRKIRGVLNTVILILTAAFYCLWYVNTGNLAQCCVLSAIAVVAASIISAVSEMIYDKIKGNVPQDMKAEYHAYIRFKINRVMFIGVMIVLVITFVLSMLLFEK